MVTLVESKTVLTLNCFLSETNSIEYVFGSKNVSTQESLLKSKDDIIDKLRCKYY